MCKYLSLMKTLLILSFMIPRLSCSPLWTKSRGSNPRPDGPARSYEYRRSNCMRYPQTYYKVARDSTGAVLIAWSRGEAEGFVIRGPEHLLEEVDAAVAQYKLHRLANSYTPRMDVRDGWSWDLYIRFPGNSISSGGCNARPADKQDAGIQAINARIQALIDAATEDDIIARPSWEDKNYDEGLI